MQCAAVGASFGGRRDAANSGRCGSSHDHTWPGRPAPPLGAIAWAKLCREILPE